MNHSCSLRNGGSDGSEGISGDNGDSCWDEGVGEGVDWDGVVRDGRGEEGSGWECMVRVRHVLGQERGFRRDRRGLDGSVIRVKNEDGVTKRGSWKEALERQRSVVV